MQKAIQWLIIIALVMTSQTLASGVETNGVGVRASALGGSYRAIADDWTAMYWNPAGLAFSRGCDAGIYTGYVMPRATFMANPSLYYQKYGGEEFKQFSAAYHTERHDKPQNVFVPAAGIAFNLKKWAFGLSMFAPMGWRAKWDILDTRFSRVGNQPGKGYNNAYPEVEYENDIRIIDIHPTVAYRISDRFSVGLGGSIVIGAIEIRQPVFLQNPYLYERTLYSILRTFSDANGLVLLDEMRKPPYDHLITEVHMDGQGTTFGANFGLMFKPAETLSIGASIQYYADLKSSGDYSQTTYFADVPAYDAQAKVYADTLFRKLYNAGLLDFEKFKIVSDFYSGEVYPRTRTNGNVTIPLPLKAGIGLSYSGFKKLLLAMDVNFTQWSAWKTLTISENNGKKISELVQNWKNTFKASMGFEYTLRSCQVRGGFGYESRAAVDESVSPTIPDIGARYNFNLGIAVPVGAVEFSLSYEHIMMLDKNIETWAYDPMGVTENIAGKYSLYANTLFAGVEYRF
jgi:long-chain fatty acid transport protein